MATGYFKNFRPGDTNTSPFTARKNWAISNGSVTGFDITGSFYTGSKIYIGTYSTSSLNNFTSGSTKEPVYNGKYQFTVHANIDKMFYRYAENGVRNEGMHQPLSSFNARSEHRELHRQVSVLSIPREIIGETITRNSINIIDKKNKTIELADDGYGNLYDKGIDSSSIVNNSQLLIHVPFNEGYIHKKSTTLGSYLFEENGLNYNSAYPYIVAGRKISFAEGMHGKCLNCTGHSGSYVIIKKQDSDVSEWGLNKDFAISMWLKIPTSQSVSHSREGSWTNLNQHTNAAGITSQIKHRALAYHDENVIATNREEIQNKAYPFLISVGNDTSGRAGKIIFRRYGGQGFSKELITDDTYNDNTFRHFLFQKTGSRLEIYVNGIRVKHKSDYPSNSPFSTITQAPITLGGMIHPESYDSVALDRGGIIGDNNIGRYLPQWSSTPGQGVIYRRNIEPIIRPFTGSIDEFRVYSRAIPSASIAMLSSSVSNTNIVGNAFYDYGIITVTSPLARYNNIFQGSGATGYVATFRNRHTIYESEYLCHIKSDDFELTMNPTARVDNTITSEKLKGMTSSSEWSPYITTVGLYNNDYELLATAKMPQPVKKPKNMDTTIVVRFDK